MIIHDYSRQGARRAQAKAQASQGARRGASQARRRKAQARRKQGASQAKGARKPRAHARRKAQDGASQAKQGARKGARKRRAIDGTPLLACLLYATRKERKSLQTRRPKHPRQRTQRCKSGLFFSCVPPQGARKSGIKFRNAQTHANARRKITNRPVRCP